MDTNIANGVSGTAGSTSKAAQRVTRTLLVCGVVAGPLWICIVLVQMLTRPGFDIRRHAVSQLSLGDLGWVQITNFILSGLLVIACAVGMRRALHGGRAGTWGPLLVGAYGLGLVAAGVFVADPGNGFPPGTPNVPGRLSGHGAMHLLVSSLAFLSLILASSVVFARRFAALGQPGWTGYSIVTGVYFFLTWVALAGTGARIAAVNVAFAVAVVLGWTWLTLLAARLMSPAHRASGR